MSTPTKERARRPNLDTVYTINDDGSRNFLHPADVHGRWQVRKNIIWGILLAIYVGTPWILIGGRPAVHIDIPGRNAFLFGHTFTNQDFYLMFFLVSGLGFGLFVVTSMLGRIWCGYACPQTVFMEGVFRRIERWIEGPRDARIRRNLGPNTRDKVTRKLVKHAVFLILAYLTAHVFLAYFIPARELVRVVTQPPSAHWAAFLWGLFWTGILYFDYGWFREQTCLIICPYGRAQSAMHDRDTIVIGYDEKRGEPRSKKTQEGGDCIDCFRCVAVCPTGIDIRDGLQMECVGCANCIDACDDIMERTQRPRGLIRYDSQRAFEEGTRRSFFRPRLFLYAALGLAGLLVFGFTVSRRDAFELRVLRSQGLPYQLEPEAIQNVYSLRIQNKRDEPAVFFLRMDVPDSAPASLNVVVPQPRLEVPALGDVRSPIMGRVSRQDWVASFAMTVAVTDSATGHTQTVDVRFRGP
ncbi:MAG: cytochrome c oxidase accessory protein CcoG [Gemmatimonadota bacterium]|nr:MAG: cytochrome c oxidase accessory protein CcoG [Gemmatimonadota bacterium]